MTNNKQQTAVKLYTEQQLTRYLLDEGIMELSDLANNLVPCIELPTDEEIKKMMELDGMEFDEFDSYDVSYLGGAKWMRNKIQGNDKQ
jgi:biotin synthase-related radical SAM superfamily protein